MDTSAIASASISLSLSRVQQDAGISILKKTMDIQQAATDTMIQSMNTAAPSSGHKLDILV